MRNSNHWSGRVRHWNTRGIKGLRDGVMVIEVIHSLSFTHSSSYRSLCAVPMNTQLKQPRFDDLSEAVSPVRIVVSNQPLASAVTIATTIPKGELRGGNVAGV